MTKAYIIEAVIAAAGIAGFALWNRRAHKRGRELLLRALAVMPQKQREAFLHNKFRRIEAELRAQLREKYHIA